MSIKTNGDSTTPVTGGGGNITSAGAFGSEPGSPNDGDLYFPDNAAVIERYNGADWDTFGPTYQFVRPIDADYAWVNQGGASVSEANGGIRLIAPAGAGNNLRMRDKAAPAVPYIIEAAFLPCTVNANFIGVGLYFRNAGAGTVVIHTIVFDSAIDAANRIYGATKFTNPTTFSANYAGIQQIRPIPVQPMWMRIADDNTNRICSVSSNGFDWHIIHSIGRTDFLTADRVGFFAESNNASFAAINHLLHWREL